MKTNVCRQLFNCKWWLSQVHSRNVQVGCSTGWFRAQLAQTFWTHIPVGCIRIEVLTAGIWMCKRAFETSHNHHFTKYTHTELHHKKTLSRKQNFSACHAIFICYHPTEKHICFAPMHLMDTLNRPQFTPLSRQYESRYQPDNTARGSETAFWSLLSARHSNSADAQASQQRSKQVGSQGRDLLLFVTKRRSTRHGCPQS